MKEFKCFESDLIEILKLSDSRYMICEHSYPQNHGANASVTEISQTLIYNTSFRIQREFCESNRLELKPQLFGWTGGLDTPEHRFLIHTMGMIFLCHRTSAEMKPHAHGVTHVLECMKCLVSITTVITVSVS